MRPARVLSGFIHRVLSLNLVYVREISLAASVRSRNLLYVVLSCNVVLIISPLPTHR